MERIDTSGLATPHEDIHVVRAWGISVAGFFEDPEIFKYFSSLLVTRAGFTIQGEPVVVRYPEKGFTYIAALTESAVTGHTWEEYGSYVNYLLQTCKKDADFSRLEDVARVVLGTNLVRVEPYFPGTNSRLLIETK